MGNMNIREKLVANRFKLAMRPVDLGVIFPVTFHWRIEAILGASKWKEAKLPDYYYTDFIDFLTLGKWSANEKS